MQRDDVMLTRREFAGIASCALCGITELVAAEASAQTTPPAATAGVTRKILSQTDGPAPGYMTLLVEATIEAGVPVGRHTHPGIESAYVLEGGFELPVRGQPTRTIKAGDGFQIPPETPHAGGKPGDTKSRILVTYVVEKGKPLASPA
jgi:quercetin dioxygenase-like cupin family protein